jgi:hypothetical protein
MMHLPLFLIAWKHHCGLLLFERLALKYSKTSSKAEQPDQ